MSTTEIPPLVILKVANRGSRLKRLRKLSVPQQLLEREQKMLDEALDDLLAACIEHGLRPTDAEVDAAVQREIEEERERGERDD